MNDRDQEFENLFKPVEMSEAEKELRAWLKHCEQILKGRPPQEVADVAIRVGHDPKVVYSVIPTFEADLRSGHLEARAAFHVWRVSDAAEQVKVLGAQMQEARKQSQKFSLLPSWKNVREYQTGEEPK